jgi:hypothetical protein
MPKLIASPTIVQCVGNINKAASEFVGLVNTGDEDISITRVQSPSGWVGIGQYSDYREYRLVFAGTLHVEHPDGAFDMQAGQCLDVEPGGRRARRVGPLFHSRSRRRRLHDRLHPRLLPRQRPPRRLTLAERSVHLSFEIIR